MDPLSTSSTTTLNQVNNYSSNNNSLNAALSVSNSPSSDISLTASSTSVITASTLLMNNSAVTHASDDMIESHNIQFKNYTVTNPPGFQQNLHFQNAPPQQNSSIAVNSAHAPAPSYPTPNHTPVSSAPIPRIRVDGSPSNSNATLPSDFNSNFSDPESPRSKLHTDNSTDHTPVPVLSTSSISGSISTLAAQTNSAKATTKPVSSSNSSLASRSNSISKVLSDMFPPNAPRDANGYPILSRDFVVRRISEGETGRLKEDIKCEACGKGYKHITSLAKHLWEHTAEWQSTKKLLISKHQQAQLLEAASILCSFTEKEAPTNGNNQAQTQPYPESHIIDIKDPKMYPLKQSVRRKSESTKTGKFGGKRRSTSFGLQTSTNMSRRDSGSAYPPSDLRRPSMHSLRPSISVSASRRGSLLGSLIKEEADNQSSMVIYDSEDEDE